MIKEFLISFSDNFKERTKNPFLGTYLVVWSFRNWELIFTLFNFDSNYTLLKKQEIIETYLKNNKFIPNLCFNITWTFGILILTYVLLNISRFIINLFEKRLTPWIYKITDSKSIVLKSKYDILKTEYYELQTALDNERESKSKLENRIKKLEQENLELKKANSELIQNNNTKELKQSKKDSDIISILIEKLKQHNLIDEFIFISTKIKKGELISDDYANTDFFIKMGLISYLGKRNTHFTKYSLTEEGELILKNLRLTT